jgi:hypothetical protein
VEYKGKAEKALKAVGAYTGYVARMGEAATSRLECAAELAAALAAVSKQPEADAPAQAADGGSLGF